MSSRELAGQRVADHSDAYRGELCYENIGHDEVAARGADVVVLAERAGLTQAKISRIEGSDTVPTLPLLAKLATALDATLNIALDNDDTQVTFTGHRTDAA